MDVLLTLASDAREQGDARGSEGDEGTGGGNTSLYLQSCHKPCGESGGQSVNPNTGTPQ